MTMMSLQAECEPIFHLPINPFAFFIGQTAPLFASRILKGDPQTKGEIIMGLGNKIIDFFGRSN